MKVITIPFAGGNRFSFAGLKPFLDQSIEVVNAELPGRGARMAEDRLKSIPEMVEDLFFKYKEHFLGKYVIYGHSLGGTLGNLLIRKIHENGLDVPIHFLVTGHTAPNSKKKKEKPRYLLNNQEFIDELKDMGGCPGEVLENEQLIDFFLPILKDDFEALETYDYVTTEKYNVPITVIAGSDEDYTDEELYKWKDETVESIDWYKLEGDHFFILDHYETIGEIINNKLLMETVKV